MYTALGLEDWDLFTFFIFTQSIVFTDSVSTFYFLIKLLYLFHAASLIAMTHIKVTDQSMCTKIRRGKGGAVNLSPLLCSTKY